MGFCGSWEAIDWEQPMKTVAELRPSTTSRRGMIKQRLVVDNSFEVPQFAKCWR